MAFDMRHVTTDDILARTTVEAGAEMYERTWCKAPPNGQEPWAGFVPPVGTWRYDDVLDEWEVLVRIPADEVTPAEQDWEFARRHWTTRYYVQWALDGHQAPPVNVVRHARGGLVSTNRRRVLAAWEAGLGTVLAWFSETGADGRALWKMEAER